MSGLIIGLGGGANGAPANYKAIIAWDGNSVPVVANIPAGVVVTYNGTQYTGTLAASASTRKYPYLIKSGNVPDAYDEYRTYQDIATGTYFWEKSGTGVDLTGYLKYNPQTLTDEQKLQARSNIGAIALTDVPVDIFTAVYDVDDPTQSTPYADIAAAYTAGKRMQVKAGFDYFPLNSVESNEYCFTGLDAELTAKKYICKTTGWEVSEIEFLTSHQSLSEYRKAANQDVIDEALAASIAPERTLAEYMAVLVRRVETLEGIINAGNLGNVKVDSIIIRDGITRYGSDGNEHLTGSGAPTVTPDHRGQKYYDLTGGHIYEAIDNTAVSNWKMTV